MENSLLQNKNIRTLVVIALIGLVGALGSYTYLTLKQAKGTYTGVTTISVTGEGEIFAKPDIGSFSFTVQATGTDATAAQNKNTEAMDAIVSYLKEAGVAENDIKTDYYNLNPKFRYEQRPCMMGGYCPPSDPIPDGFDVMQNVTVKVRALDTAGKLIAGVGEKGATNISSLQFTIDDESVLKDQARTEAIDNAKEKAQALADSLGMKLGKIVGFYENEGMPMPMYAGGAMMERAASAPMKAMDAVVPTGENTIKSNVSISYELY